MGFDVNVVLLLLFEFLINILGNNLFGVLLLMFLIYLLWLFGIYGMSIVGVVVCLMWLIMLDENVKVLVDGIVVIKLFYIVFE